MASRAYSWWSWVFAGLLLALVVAMTWGPMTSLLWCILGGAALTLIVIDVGPLLLMWLIFKIAELFSRRD